MVSTAPPVHTENVIGMALKYPQFECIKWKTYIHIHISALHYIDKFDFF
jgi:hypothetical protein